MALRAILDTLDGLSDPVKAEYKAGDDGKFYLQVETVTLAPDKIYALENVGGLKKSLETERGARAAAEQKLTPFNGLDPAAARDALEKVKTMANWTPEQKVSEQILAVKQQLEAKHTAELSATQALLAKREKQLTTTKIQEAATRAIIAAGDPDAVNILMPHIERQVRLRLDGEVPIVEVLGPGDIVRVSPAANSSAPMSLDELVAEMKVSPTFKRAFPASGASGSGASGAAGAGGASQGAGGGGGGGKGGTIRASDSAAMSQNMEKIASGEVTVDMGG